MVIQCSNGNPMLKKQLLLHYCYINSL